MRLLEGVKRIGFVELGVDDIVRHRLIKDIILRYERPAEAARLSKEEEDREYLRRSHFPGWSPDREGYDFSNDDDDEEPENYDEANAQFAEEWRRAL